MQRNNFPWFLAVICGTVIILALLFWQFSSRTRDEAVSRIDRGLAVGKEVIRKLPEIAEKFRTAHITETFRESVIDVQSTGGDILEVAIARNDETFIRSEENKAFFGYLDLGTTVSEIRAPVTFRYHLRLSDRWELETRSNVCLVLAPMIRPSLPPALHTDQMVKKTQSGWAEFNAQEKLDELEKTITPKLEKRAMDKAHLNLVREQSRKSVAEFVKRWLMKEDHWRQDRFSSIIVRFPDEVTDSEITFKSSDRPTVRLEDVK